MICTPITLKGQSRTSLWSYWTVGDVDAMAKYAIALLSDKEKLTLFKHQAYEYACRFDVHKIVPCRAVWLYYMILAI